MVPYSVETSRIHSYANRVNDADSKKQKLSLFKDSDIFSEKSVEYLFRWRSHRNF